MAGYIGSKVNVSQIDGYVKSEVDTLLGQELNLSGGSMTGHLNFGDNIKSQYGAGTDLQIYHDASHSYIKDAGTGNLRLSATTIELMKVDTSELMASFSGDGAVTLYYDNAAKLATTATGISVTGTVTATGSIALNDGTDNFNIGVTTNRLTIKSTTSDGSDDTSILIDAGKVIYQMGNVSGSTTLEKLVEILRQLLMPQATWVLAWCQKLGTSPTMFYKLALARHWSVVPQTDQECF